MFGMGLGRLGFGGSEGFSLARNFFAGQQGFDYSDIDITKTWGSGGIKLLYSDLGATAISASTQTARLALDKSQNAALGSELVASPLTTSIFNAGGDVTFAQNGSFVNITRGAGAIGSTISIPGVAANTRYLVSGTVSGGNNRIFIGTNSTMDGGGNITLTGTFSNIITFVPSGNTNTLWCDTGQTITIQSLSIRAIPGNHAYQHTAGSRPAWTDPGGGGVPYLLGDGTADNLLTALTPATSFSMIACGRIGTASRTIIGSKTAGSDEISIGLDASGFAKATLGATTLNGAADLRGADHVIGLRTNGTTAELWVDGALVDSDTPGTVNTTIALSLMARNANGTADQFTDGRLHRALAVKQHVSNDNHWLASMRLAGQNVVSF